MSFEVDPDQLPLLADAVRSFSGNATAAAARVTGAPLAGIDVGAVPAAQEALHQLYRWREYAHDEFIALAAKAEHLLDGLELSAVSYQRDDRTATALLTAVRNGVA